MGSSFTCTLSFSSFAVSMFLTICEIPAICLFHLQRNVLIDANTWHVEAKQPRD
ncbi:hypothetical protein CC80DRAFT_487395 [Byssothecium circinans]|uniref:Uncharacterized protein n=1 Tax=Byssothecium circinans TaxID=147558 RepID=A0A6A5UDH0_9PLEO|nr:hypothetical protein CC80DRAFT_487395 [Byssothecium circinans]